MAFVRRYDPSRDHETCIHVFRETCDRSLQSEPLLTLASYHWCRPYLLLSPSTCFVLDDGTGRAVGYCIGVPDTAAFCEAWKVRYLPSLNQEADSVTFDTPPFEPSLKVKAIELLDNLWKTPEQSMDGDVPGLWDAYPGHLHIDILPSHTSQGYGPRLIDHFFDELKAAGCPGVHLGLVATNVRALTFYQRIGMVSYPPAPAGESNSIHDESGKSSSTIIMVRNL